MLLQELNLKIGEQAICSAGKPRKSSIIVACIKDFDTATYEGDVTNNPYNFVRVTASANGAFAAHWVSAEWVKIPRK